MNNRLLDALTGSTQSSGSREMSRYCTMVRRNSLNPKWYSIRALVSAAGADVISIGYPTLHEAHAHLQENLDVPVINPGPLSYFIAEALADLGLTQSRSAYPSPLVAKPEMVHAMLDAAARSEAGS